MQPCPGETEVGFVSLEPGRGALLVRVTGLRTGPRTSNTRIVAHGRNQAVGPGINTCPQGPSESGVGSSSRFISTIRVNTEGG